MAAAGAKRNSAAILSRSSSVVSPSQGQTMRHRAFSGAFRDGGGY